jgi:hypothetical protein
MSRGLLIRILLWALAAAAASGLLAVFLSDRELVLRLTGMGFVTAGAAGLMLPCTLMVDKARTRAAGLLGMTLCAVEFLLAVAFIWSGLGWSNLDEQVGLTMVVLALVGLPSIGLLALAFSPFGRVAGRVGTGLAAANLVVYLVAVWFEVPGKNEIRDKLFETGGSLSGAAVLAITCMVGIGTDRKNWRWFGIVASAAALLMLLYGIWIHSSNEVAPLVCVFSVAALAAYANVATMLPLTPGQMWLRWSAVGAAAATGLFIDLDSIVAGNGSAPMLERFATGCGIITASATLALLVLGRLNRRPDYEGGKGEPARTITLVCPRCRKKQTLPVGSASCAGCKLRIFTRIELPLCPVCGYDTSILAAGGRCPECGTAVSAGEQDQAESQGH